MTTTLTLDELETAGERELGTSSWHEIDQEKINLFAEATGCMDAINAANLRAKRN